MFARCSKQTFNFHDNFHALVQTYIAYLSKYITFNKVCTYTRGINYMKIYLYRRQKTKTCKQYTYNHRFWSDFTSSSQYNHQTPPWGLPTTLGQQERGILPSTLLTQSLASCRILDGAWNMGQWCPTRCLKPQPIEQLDRQHGNFPQFWRVKLKNMHTCSKPPPSQVSKKNRERMPTKKTTSKDSALPVYHVAPSKTNLCGNWVIYFNHGTNNQVKQGRRVAQQRYNPTKILL